LSMKRGSYVPSSRSSLRANFSTFCPLTEKIYKSMTFVDVPGDARARGQVSKFVDSSVKGIVFMVDGSNWTAQQAEAGEYLYQILTDSRILKMKIPVIVVASKSDLTATAVAEKVVRDGLMSELSRLRTSKAGSVSDIGEDSSAAPRTELPADRSGRFTEDVSPLPLSFTTISTKNRNWEKLEDFVMTGAFRK